MDTDGSKEKVIDCYRFNQVLFYLESLIGTGKSTFFKTALKLMNRNAIKTNCYPEPIDNSLLHLHYSDVKKYAFSFQSIVIRERVHINEDAFNDLLQGDADFIVLERSQFGDCGFALTHKKYGNISEKEFEVYTNLIRSNRLDRYRGSVKNEYLVFFRCSPEKARERIIIRGNKDEIENCTLEYLTDLDESYMKILSRKGGDELEQRAIDEVHRGYPNGMKTIIIDYNEDLQIDEDGCIVESQFFQILWKITEKFI